MYSDCDSIQDNDQDILRSPLLSTDHNSSNECQDSKGPLNSEDRPEDFDPRSTCYTIVSSTLLFFSAGLIGLSFLLPWSRAHLTFKNDHLPSNLNMPIYNDATILEIFSTFNSCHHRMIVIIVSIATIIAPVLWCSIQAMFISALYKPDSDRDSQWPRKLPSFLNAYSGLSCSGELISKSIPYAQLLTKFSMLVVYINMLFQGYISVICFTFGGSFDQNSSLHTNKEVLAHPEIITTDGMITYTIGVICGVFSFMNLDLHLRYRYNRFNNDFTENDNQDRNEPSIFSPPSVAFKHCHLKSPNHIENVSDSIEHLSTSSNECDDTSETRQLLCDHRDDTIDHLHRQTNDIRSKVTKSSELSKAFSFETGLLSILLFAPSVTCPLFKIHPSGILTSLIEDNNLMPTSYSLVNIVSLLTMNVHREFFSMSVLLLFWFNVILVPGIVWTSSSIAWFLCIIRREKYAIGPIILATNLSPHANLSVFSVAILILFSSISIISNHIFDENPLCQLSKEVSMESQSSPCLNLSASFEPTMFLLLLQIWCTSRFLVSMKMRS